MRTAVVLMSAHVIGWLYNTAPDGVTGVEMAIAQCLANHAQDDGRNAFPAISRMAQETRFAERTVRHALRALEAKGVVAVQHPATNRRSTTYWFPGYVVTCVIPRDVPRGAGDAAQEHAREASDASRGARGAVRGARDAPYPSLTVKEPPENQTDDVARAHANGSLTVLRPIDDLDPDERAALDQDRQELAAELKAAAAFEAAEHEKQRQAALEQHSGGVSVWDR